MYLQKTYALILGLYPDDFQEEFGEEMQSVFRRMSEQQRRRPGLHFFLFSVREFAGLIAGAIRERFLRPAPAAARDLPFPTDRAGAERYIRIVSRRLIHAIANHDFAGARYYDLQDRKARALLAQLGNTAY